jgi:hypothetical protein
MCPPCFDFALRGLVEENTQTITLKKESHDEDDEVTVVSFNSKNSRLLRRYTDLGLGIHCLLHHRS